MNDWFEALLGFRERSPTQVRENLVLEGTRVRPKANCKAYKCGGLEIVSLQELRLGAAEEAIADGELQFSELVVDARGLHLEVGDAGAMFQVAS